MYEISTYKKYKERYPRYVTHVTFIGQSQSSPSVLLSMHYFVLSLQKQLIQF